ncbi:MAG: 30S ribosomal protein S5 [Parcubacteria group bacterium RIFCSPLOWO2_01_FULL_48_18]|nr:MAG: 30S ribosomal protein S5 [Parcubacteria group bacterium RIFCSPLOWO2_01_FULL_48_18]OHB24146.1 MAG: 30S ribosomal protein S5 [Parcubacteria group bacterium RIFCSPHIGHO2_02_FULL_48_10b]
MKPQDEFGEKNLDVRRVTRVVAGGKRFRFRATIVVGNKRGRVGIGTAKGVDVASAVAKAKALAKKCLVSVSIKEGTIAHDVEGKFSSAVVFIKPASRGHGLVAGGAVRAVLSLAGISDATAKILSRTTNKLTNAMAALEALKKLKA